MQTDLKGRDRKKYPTSEISWFIFLKRKCKALQQYTWIILDEIVIPYIEKERTNLQLWDDQPALLIIDVFSGQMTEPVIKKIRESSINLVNSFVPDSGRVT